MPPIFSFRGYFSSPAFVGAGKKKFLQTVKNISGCTPRSPELYELAFRHSSMVKGKEKRALECNERLEFLGDAVLNLAVGEYLFKKFPMRDEGFLTQMRSKIVNREHLNHLAKKLGIQELIQYSREAIGKDKTIRFKSSMGDALEAFVGAVYMDFGFEKAKKCILGKMVVPLLDMEQLEKTDTNFKSQLLELAQGNALPQPEYELAEERVIRSAGSGRAQHHYFTMRVKIQNEILGTAIGANKRKAEQLAAEQAFYKLQEKLQNTTHEKN